MSVGLGLLRCLLESEDSDLSTLTENGVTLDHFVDGEQVVFDFIESHLKKHGRLPKLATVQREKKIKFDRYADEPLSYWLSSVHSRWATHLTGEGAKQALKLAKTDPERARRKIAEVHQALEGSQGIGSRVQIASALEVLNMDFTDTKWVLPGILPEGLTILAGKPKQGKSILALNLCAAVAGLLPTALSAVAVDQGPVLYLALEDTQKRINQRLRQMQCAQGYILEAASRLRFCFAGGFPRMGNGGIECLEHEIKKTADLRLVVIDTLALFRPASNPKNQSAYDVDYQTMAEVKRVADRHTVVILIVHHLRKMTSDDIMDTISGTFGLSGAADGLLALARKTGQTDAVLHVTGRDVETSEHVLRFNSNHLLWELCGSADVVLTDQQQRIYDAVKDADGPLSPRSISEATGLEAAYVRATLPRLISKGLILRADRRYIAADAVV